MCKYRSIIEKPEKLRSMTGLTADEFHALVPIFHTAFEAYMKRRTIDGHVRYCRRYVSYANSPLPTTEVKLLFILTYLKHNPTHVMHGHIFQMSQSNVSKWVHLLHGALNYALSQQNLLPAPLPTTWRSDCRKNRRMKNRRMKNHRMRRMRPPFYP